MITACKKDAPIYPGDPGFIAYTGKTGTPPATGSGTGTGTNTGTNNAQLTGTWVVVNYYNLGYINTSLVSTEEKHNSADYHLDFIKIDMNDASKNALSYSGVDGSANEITTYVYNAGKGEILFAKNPFIIGINDKTTPVKITNASASSMTWTYVNPDGLQVIPGQTQYYGVKVVLLKQQ